MVRYVRGMCLQSEDKTLPYVMQAYFSDLPLAGRRGYGRPNGSAMFNVHCMYSQTGQFSGKDGCIGTTQTKTARNHARLIFPFRQTLNLQILLIQGERDLCIA